MTEHRVSIDVDGVIGGATLFHETAPWAVEKLWDAMPIEWPLRQARWSGEQTYMKLDNLADPSAPVENQVSLCSRGQIVFRPERGMLSITYGRAQLRDQPSHHPHINGWGILVGIVDENVDEFLAKCASTNHVGSLPTKFSRR